ncbi:hypothetical protein LAZ67_X001001 [Cordylochernes scorpioides]|uniref:Uncharacterized protein n=1 Tax=Cordylochernes scorpioides TaxID=51811 RepID=A0ABY6LS39_9ARAC|nr:hypothetical protein LAZ67_X001001 [Cordylochernes scorpioides]
MPETKQPTKQCVKADGLTQRKRIQSQLQKGLLPSNVALEDEPPEGQLKILTTIETIERCTVSCVRKLRPWEYRIKGCEHLARRIRDAKALRKVGSTFAECRSKSNAQPTFTAIFEPIQEGSDRFCAAISSMDMVPS